MANTVTIKVEGLQQLGRNLRALQSEVTAGKILRQAASSAAALVRDRARELAAPHKKTGLLEKSIAVRRSRAESRPGHEVYAVGVFKVHGGYYADNARNRQKGRVGKQKEVAGKAFYWTFLEFGTVNQGATPFLVPAFLSMRGEAIEKMKEKTTSGIAAAVQKLPVTTVKK